MQRALLFGAGEGAKRLFDEISEKYVITAVTDNDPDKWGASFKNLPIGKPSEICSETKSWDLIVPTTFRGYESIGKQLAEYGISRSAIDDSFVSRPIESRKVFLRNLSELFSSSHTSINGACAEAGVYTGDFAKYINEYFPGRKLYLFDTFEGFDTSDAQHDKESGFSNPDTGKYDDTNVELVLKKMRVPDNCIIRKGYFPDTAKGIDDKFIFVNLDLDLYNPIAAGLQWFGERMEENGVILVHDYFAPTYKGVKKAVDEYMVQNKNLRLLPIGDGLSVAVTGY